MGMVEAGEGRLLRCVDGKNCKPVIPAVVPWIGLDEEKKGGGGTCGLPWHNSKFSLSWRGFRVPVTAWQERILTLFHAVFIVCLPVLLPPT